MRENFKAKLKHSDTSVALTFCLREPPANEMSATPNCHREYTNEGEEQLIKMVTAISMH